MLRFTATRSGSVDSSLSSAARAATKLALGGLALFAVVLRPAGALAAFDLDTVASMAETLAEKPFHDTKGQVPDWLLDISYDQWREIRFRPEQALWRDRGLPFEVQFFHAGLYYNRTVAINEVDADGVHPVKFSPSQFDYGSNTFSSRVPQDLGYAGFRLHYPIRRPDYRDEVIVFLGATYFRAVGRDQGFGLSARGLAVDTASSSGEEFPFFKEFWLVRPTRDAHALALYALVDSARVTGAYRFVVYPGEQTVVEVEGRLFLRQPIAKLGVAPLTSMFFFGENTLRRFDDYRPEVHDSDGLLLAGADGEWIWRPVDNPNRLRLSEHHLPHPKGFGLIQRDRDFDHYQDLETRPDLRPSAWIEPRGDWGDGHVELVEIPTQNDSNDNVVAFWVPEKAPVPGEPFSFSYTSYWYGEDPSRPPGGRTTATRQDDGTFKHAHRFVLDFLDKKLQRVPGDKVLQAVVSVSGDDAGAVLEQQTQKNSVTGGWRLTFQVRSSDEEPLEMRAFLQQGDEALTETWSYVTEP